MKISIAQLAVLALPALIVASSCTKENGGLTGEPGTLSFVVGSNDAMTKAGLSAESKTIKGEIYDLSEETGIEGLQLVETITYLDDSFAPAAETKGTPIYTENLANIYNSLKVKAGSEEVDFGYVGDDRGGRMYRYDYTNKPSDGTYLFIRTPDSPAGTYDTSTGTISLSYTTPTTATAQKDILYTSKKYKSSENRADILLYHPLVGVKFQNGNAKTDGDNNITTITSVKLSGLYSAASCTITPKYEGSGWSGRDSNPAPGTTEKSKDCVSWAYSGTANAAYTAEFSSDEQATMEYGGSGKLPSSFTPNSTYNLNDSAYSKTFFVIPPVKKTEGGKDYIDQDVTVTVTFAFSGKTFEKSISLKGHQAWQPGELHTYTLSLAEVAVEVSDDMNNGTKSNVHIQNTGNALSYIRAAVVANWMDANGKIFNVAWTPASITTGTNWVKGTDGFYYYTSKVKGGAVITNDLFTSYTAGNPPTGVPSSAHLEMSIIVQAIEAASLSDAQKAGWGTGITFTSTVDGGK